MTSASGSPYPYGGDLPDAGSDDDQAWASASEPVPVPVLVPVPASEPKPRADRWQTKTLVGIATAVVVAALGYPLGWLWSTIAPWLPVTVSGGELYYAEPQGEQRAAQESWFIILSIGVGIVVAIAAWLVLRRFRGAFTVIALAVGGVFAGVLAWRFGHNIGRGHAFALARAAPDNTTIKVPVDLRIKRLGLWHGWLPYVGGDLLYLAIAAAVVYLLIAGFTASPSLGVRHPDRPPANPE